MFCTSLVPPPAYCPYVAFKRNNVLLFSDRDDLLGTGEKVNGLYHMKVEIFPQDTATVECSSFVRGLVGCQIVLWLKSVSPGDLGYEFL